MKQYHESVGVVGVEGEKTMFETDSKISRNTGSANSAITEFHCRTGLANEKVIPIAIAAKRRASSISFSRVRKPRRGEFACYAAEQYSARFGGQPLKDSFSWEELEERKTFRLKEVRPKAKTYLPENVLLLMTLMTSICLIAFT